MPGERGGVPSTCGDLPRSALRGYAGGADSPHEPGLPLLAVCGNTGQSVRSPSSLLFMPASLVSLRR
jgi:hypothetical protein